MFRTFLSIVVSAASWLQFLNWAWDQTETQIDRIQDAAFNTPGVESPVPPAILVGAAGVLTSHFALSRVLRLRLWQSVLSLLLGVAVSSALVLSRPRPAR